MTIQQLKYILALEKHRHFVRASESCFVAQPTLTLQVKKLEEEIGFLIFDRSKQPLEPTSMGIKFIHKSREIIRQIDSLKELIHSEKELLEGHFTLGVIPTLAPYILPLFLQEFSAAHPKIFLEVKEMQTSKIIEEISKGTLDIGLLVTPLEEKTIREIPLFHEPFLVYLNKKHHLNSKELVTPQDLTPNDLWLLDEGHCFRNQVLNICENKKKINPTEGGFYFQSGSIETLKKLVSKSFGYTLIPELALNSNDLVKRFTEPELVREVSLVVHNSFTKERLLGNLRKEIVKCVPDSFKKNNRFVTVNWR